MCFFALIILIGMQVSFAQEKPKVFFSDDFLLESSPPAYLWFYDQKGILDKTNKVDGYFVEIVKAFAKNCECTVVKEPDDANYVVVISRHDVVFGAKLSEKKFVIIKVDGEKLVAKGSVRRASNIASNSCKAILKDWKSPSGESAHNN
jgi:fructose-specific component phosphotransferase system IIB-like protein